MTTSSEYHKRGEIIAQRMLSMLSYCNFFEPTYSYASEYVGSTFRTLHSRVAEHVGNSSRTRGPSYLFHNNP